MKLWKGVSFALMLCGAGLSIFLTRKMPTAAAPLGPRIPDPQSFSTSALKSPLKPPMAPAASPSSRSTPSSPPPPRPPLSSEMGGLRRAARETESISSLLSEYSRLLRSFTEGELQQVIGALVDRRAQRDGLEEERQEERQEESQEERQEERQEESQTRRSRRARRRPPPCSLRQLELTVSDLGLGYASDETLLFRYCSGKCAARRRNYDITLERVRRAGLVKRGKKDQAEHTPCCRPITYEEKISFLDNDSRYHTIQELSARECGCV